jgi:hypothetical protein
VSKKLDKKKISLPLANWERDLLDGTPPQYPPYPVVQAPQPVGFTPATTYRTLGANVMADNDATVAHVNYNGSYQDKDGWHELAFDATGSSKRERGDSYDREIGELLASSRALEKMAARMKRRAKGLIRTQDSIAQHRRLAAEKREQLEGFDLNELFRTFPGLRVISPEDFVSKVQERLAEDDAEPVAAEFPSIEAAFDALRGLGQMLSNLGTDDEDGED